MEYWKNKVCLVTGSSAGLGLHIARTLLSRGAHVVMNGRDPERLQQAADSLPTTSGNVLTLPGDVTEAGLAKQLVDETVTHFGKVDFVCHAAGRSMRGELLATSGDDFDALWKINTRGAFDLACASADALAAEQGHLVLVGSLASRLGPRFLGAYPPSKFPLAAMAQQLRLERGPSGLHTLLVCPGPIARDQGEGGDRYAASEKGVPASASRPGGGAKVSALDPVYLSEQILIACEKRKPELVLPRKVRLLFVLSQLSPRLGDWLLSKTTG